MDTSTKERKEREGNDEILQDSLNEKQYQDDGYQNK